MYRYILIVSVLIVLHSPCTVGAVSGQNARSVDRATSVRIEVEKPEIYGPLFITIAGKEKRITGEAQQAWIINDGRHVVYSSSKGAGGYENEGQGLHLYDVANGRHKQILSEYFMVDTVKEVVTSKKKRALLVAMSDGGLGASYTAVVDPLRGEVFFQRWTRILTHSGDTLVLGFYKEDDWGQDEKVRPYKTRRYNLSSLLLRPVIVNKRDKID
ncbi:MAG TPA: hypothetical protein VF075_14810 [Pyrinomonadaceae bacterium]